MASGEDTVCVGAVIVGPGSSAGSRVEAPPQATANTSAEMEKAAAKRFLRVRTVIDGYSTRIF